MVYPFIFTFVCALFAAAVASAWVSPDAIGWLAGFIYIFYDSCILVLIARSGRAGLPPRPELAQKIAQAVPAPLVRADVGATYDHYSPNSAGRTREWSAFTQVGATLGQFIPSLRFEHFRYFGNNDSTITAGLVYRVTRDVLVAADAGYTPGLSQFRPKWLANLGGEVVFTPQVAALATYRHMHFEGFGEVDMVMPALRFQVGSGFEAQVGGVVAHNVDASVTGAFVARVSYDYRDILFPYAGFSHGQESLPPFETAANTTVGTLGLVWNITPRLSVRADYAHEHRTRLDDSLIYDHDSIGTAVTVRF